MYIRCRDCHGSIWIPSEEDAVEAVTAACRRCDRSYVLEVSEFLRSTGERFSELARCCASDNDIDLPSAYSVLYGVLDLKEIRDLQKKSAAIHARSETPTAVGLEFDPAFQDAVPGRPARAARGIRRESGRPASSFDGGRLRRGGQQRVAARGDPQAQGRRADSGPARASNRANQICSGNRRSAAVAGRCNPLRPVPLPGS